MQLNLQTALLILNVTTNCSIMLFICKCIYVFVIIIVLIRNRNEPEELLCLPAGALQHSYIRVCSLSTLI